MIRVHAVKRGLGATRNTFAVCLCVALLALISSPARAQDKHEFAGQFLTNKQGELCTMCEADVSCAAVATEEQPTPAQTKLHFLKRDFWGQISTVLDYFPLTRKYGLYHSRDVQVKSGEGPDMTANAKLDLEAKRIDVTDRNGTLLFWIDRTDGAWKGPDNTPRGQCTVEKM
jgi:hypothetical protein